MLIRTALYLAERGWHVFPLQPGGKRPALHGQRSCSGTGGCSKGHLGWEQRASVDPVRIRRCWELGPFNIGLAPGPSGLVVIDCDQPKPGYLWPEGWSNAGLSSGLEVLHALAERAGRPLPKTYTISTPSGGTHFYFRAPHRKLRNTCGNLGPLIDTRAHGGYVVAEGSSTSEGAYELADDSEPANLPGWLVEALVPKAPVAISAPCEIAAKQPSRYVAAAIVREAERLASVGTGPQNWALYTAALALGGLVAGGAVDDATVRAALHGAMSRLPLTRPHEPWEPAQIDATINSAFRAARSRPRRLTSGNANAA